MEIIRQVLKFLSVAAAALLMLGTGLCSLVTLPIVLPAAWQSPQLLLINLTGWGTALAMFFLIKRLIRSFLTAKALAHTAADQRGRSDDVK